MNVLWTVVALLTMLLGLVGTVIPGVPGIPLIYAAMLGYGALTGWQYYGAGAMIFWGVITGLSLVVEYVAGSGGARRFGASAFGIWGSIAGAIIGALVGHLPGLVIGTFAGAVAGELCSGRPWREALRSGQGALIGFVAGTFLKLVVGVLMMGTFLWWIIR